MIGRIARFFRQVIENDHKYQESDAYYHKKRMERKIKRNCHADELDQKLRILQLNFCKSMIHRESNNKSNLDEK
jgi:hypothetical protein